MCKNTEGCEVTKHFSYMLTRIYDCSGWIDVQGSKKGSKKDTVHPESGLPGLMKPCRVHLQSNVHSASGQVWMFNCNPVTYVIYCLFVLNHFTRLICQAQFLISQRFLFFTSGDCEASVSQGQGGRLILQFNNIEIINNTYTNINLEAGQLRLSW